MTTNTATSLLLAPDERLRKTSALRKSLMRPELGALCGTILVFLLFLAVAPTSGMFSLEGAMNWGAVSAQFAVIAVGACLLMITGEFDLSIGSMIGFSGIVIALASRTLGLPVWAAILAAFAIALAIGASGPAAALMAFSSFERATTPAPAYAAVPLAGFAAMTMLGWITGRRGQR